MTSYAFHELTRRAQENAVANYGEEQIVQEMVEELKESCDRDLTAKNVFSCLGWRFTEHGERVA